MKKKVLLIGSSYSALPILFYLKEKGYKVSVCGAYKDDPAHLYADENFYIDYSNKEDLLNLCKKEKFNYLVPSCNDYAYNSASYVANRLGFVGFDNYETTMLLHTKDKLRRFLVTNGFSSPKIYGDLKNIKYPILIKPVSQFSGRGIIKINSYEEIKKQKIDGFVIEEFIDGKLYSHSAFIENKRIKKDFFVREYCLTYEYQVDASYVINLDKKIVKNIRYEIEKLAQELNLADGLLHTQFLLKDNRFYIIETMRRCPGDLYSVLINKSTNQNYIQNYVNPFIGQNIKFNKDKRIKYVIRHTISVKDTLNFKSLSFHIKNFEFYPLKTSGDIAKKAPYDKIGIFFYKLKNLKDLKKNILQIKKTYKIKRYQNEKD